MNILKIKLLSNETGMGYETFDNHLLCSLVYMEIKKKTFVLSKDEMTSCYLWQ